MRKSISSFLRLSQEERPPRSKIISLRHLMQHYMIGVSERDIKIINPENISGLYVLKRRGADTYYDKMKGLVINHLTRT